jgi:hypothetical protein
MCLILPGGEAPSDQRSKGSTAEGNKPVALWLGSSLGRSHESAKPRMGGALYSNRMQGLAQSESTYLLGRRRLAVSNSNKSCCLRRWWPLFWRSGKGKYSIPCLSTSGTNNALRFQGHVKLLSFRKLNSISWDTILYHKEEREMD